MTDNGIAQGDFTDTDGELVVDLPYVRLFTDYVGRLGGTVQVSDRADSALGLGVVTVENIEILSAKIRATPKESNDRHAPREEPRTNIGVVLGELRRQIRNDHRGWMFDVGRNRPVNGVHGSPHIGGGSTYPEAVTAQAAAIEPVPRSDARIGLIDTKLYPADRFAGRVVALGDSLLPVDGPFTHLAGHGTLSAGLILDKAPGSVVVTQAVLSDKKAVSTVWEVATAIARFADRDVSVLVLPLVCFTADGERPLALQRAVDLLRNKVVVLAAAGNHGDAEPDPELGLDQDSPAFPAACDGVVAVGSVNESTGERMGLARFTPRQRPWIDLVGPGENVEGTFLRGEVEFRRVSEKVRAPEKSKDTFTGRARWSGTSFATATVGGLIASRVRPGETAFDVVDKLREQDPRQNGGIGGYEFL